MAHHDNCPPPCNGPARGAALAGLGMAGLALAAWWGRARWQRTTHRLVAQLLQERAAAHRQGSAPAPLATPAPATVSLAQLDALPEPVARYLRLALTPGQALVRCARIAQVGRLRSIGTPPGRWMRFGAHQVVSPGELPGFVWDARVHAGAGLQMWVRDAFVRGQGQAQVSALGCVALARSQGGPQLAEAALMRYLAEAVWLPTALLPSAQLRWSAIDGRRALATLTQGSTTAALEFAFNSAGEVACVSTPGRYAAMRGGFERLPWSGEHGAYARRAGMWVPTQGQVQWHLPSGALTVWQGRNVAMDYTFVP